MKRIFYIIGGMLFMGLVLLATTGCVSGCGACGCVETDAFNSSSSSSSSSGSYNDPYYDSYYDSSSSSSGSSTSSSGNTKKGIYCRTKCTDCTWYPFLFGCYENPSCACNDSSVSSCEAKNCVVFGVDVCAGQLVDTGSEYTQVVSDYKQEDRETTTITLSAESVKGVYANIPNTDYVLRAGEDKASLNLSTLLDYFEDTPDATSVDILVISVVQTDQELRSITCTATLGGFTKNEINTDNNNNGYNNNYNNNNNNNGEVQISSKLSATKTLGATSSYQGKSFNLPKGEYQFACKLTVTKQDVLLATAATLSVSVSALAFK